LITAAAPYMPADEGETLGVGGARSKSCATSSDMYSSTDVLQCVVACCGVLQCMLQCVAVCYNVMQGVAIGGGPRAAPRRATCTLRLIHCVVVCCSVLQCVAVCGRVCRKVRCSMLQCLPVRCRALQWGDEVQQVHHVEWHMLFD
jgi:hypothetical protein